MKQELISIIVPCYNVEQYLDKCVTSIVNQTYQNLEIILIDDGSTDMTGKLCDKWGKIDKRIRVIHRENGGLSAARNSGIEIAKGKYFLFIDSDDYVNREIVNFLYNDLKKNKADISTCQRLEFYDNQSPIVPSTQNQNFVFETVDALSELLYEKNVTTSAWGKLYNSKLFKNIRYPEGKICEDLPTTYLLFAKSTRVSINTNKMYYYLIRKNSIIHSKFNKKRLDAIEFAKDETNFIRKNFPSIINSAINREFMEAIYISLSIPYTKEYKESRKELKSIIKKYRKTIINDKNVKKSSKIYGYASIFGLIGIKTIFQIKKLLDVIRR